LIRFTFNEKKSTQVAALLLQKHNNEMDGIKLLKLLYAVDRVALGSWERPLTGDCYYAMKNGPVLSIIYDIIKHKEDCSDKSFWYDHIFSSWTASKKVTLTKIPGDDELSQREIDLIDSVFNKLGHLKTWKLVDLTHYFPEWKDPGRTSASIRIEEILKVFNKTQDDIDRINEEAENLNYLHELLAI